MGITTEYFRPNAAAEHSTYSWAAGSMPAATTPPGAWSAPVGNVVGTGATANALTPPQITMNAVAQQARNIRLYDLVSTVTGEPIATRLARAKVITEVRGEFSGKLGSSQAIISYVALWSHALNGGKGTRQQRSGGVSVGSFGWTQINNTVALLGGATVADVLGTNFGIIIGWYYNSGVSATFDVDAGRVLVGWDEGDSVVGSAGAVATGIPLGME